ncbi:hypothetical protein KJ359_005530 [Pestalotiopsis sp. 9143b]|nr:hypothetical protein KJ359_005530 [Pestalotiopsis sp. 9143b]
MSTTKESLSTYILSDDESHRIFQEQIIPAELGHLQHSSNDHKDRPPLAVFVIGQTGAGKTRTAPAIKEVMQARRGEPSHLIADTFKTFHPAYSELISSETPDLASPATGTDARRWLAMAISHVIESRADVLVESACRHPEDFAELGRALHAGRYRVEVVVLAVPAALSRLGVLTRYHERLPEAGSRGLPIRLTPRKVHDDSYAGLVDAARFVDESGAVDQVVVVRRGNQVVYSNERVNESWEKDGSTVAALLHERERSLPPGEQSVACEDVKRLRELDSPGLLSEIPDIECLTSFFDAPGNKTQLRDLVLPRMSTAHVRFGTQMDLSLGLETP